MEWIILMCLMAGVFINLCLVAYILGILYAVPLAFGADYDPPSLLISLVGIIVTTVLAVQLYRRGRYVMAFCVLYGWWMVVWFMLRRLFLHWWA